MLAEKLKVTRQTISNWELGENVLDLKLANELSKIFDVSLDDLIGKPKQNVIVEKLNKTENKFRMIFKILKVIGITIGILLFLMLVVIVSVMFLSDYFSAGSTGQGEGLLVIIMWNMFIMNFRKIIKVAMYI